MSIFSKVNVSLPKRSTFNLSHDVKLTCDFGKLVPFICEEVVPADTWQLQSNVLLRFSPLIAPVMHDINVYTHYFYVPFRLLWDEYEDFITGGKDGNAAPIFPRLGVLHKTGVGETTWQDTKGLWKRGSLADYLNYPTSDSNDGSAGSFYASVLPLRAYQMIYNEYYRDENLEEEIEFSKGSGIVNINSSEYVELLTLRERAWAKDYFTSALPWLQRGPQQMVPVSSAGKLDSTDISYKGVEASSGVSSIVDTYSGQRSFITQGGEMGEHGEVYGGLLGADNPTGQPRQVAIDNSNNLKLADDGVTIEGTSFTINDLRRSNRIQRWLEASARGGNRYIESLLSFFGVKSDDLSLQRPQFLGGGKTPVQISDVLQTSETTANSPQGQYSGIGYSFGTHNSFKKSFKERGLIIGIMSIMPKPGYTEGCPRSYRKFDKYDFYWPQFAELGEQEIYNYELALRTADVDGTFGYAPRYAEYKYIPSRVHGDFKNMNGLGFWHLNRHYNQQPVLTKEFVHCRDNANDLNRIFAVEDNESNHIYVQIANNVTARRMMPYLPDPEL